MAFFRTLPTRAVLSIDTLIRKVEDLRQEIGGRGGDRAPAGCGTQRVDNGRPAGTPPPSDGPPPPVAAAVPETVPERTGGGLAADSPNPLAAAWQGLVQIVSRNHPSLGANLKKCGLRHADSKRVEIIVPASPFISSMLQREKNLSLLKKICAEVFGGRPDVIVTAAGESGDSSTERRDRHQSRLQETLNHPLVAEAIEIFNGKLVDVQIRQEVDE
jgi:DNA polymerase-3 subunit gamma/tau